MPLSQQITCSHRKIAINRYSHKPYLQNCGKCFPCQLMKRNKSLHRLFCEQAKSYKYHYFITLTFDDNSIYFVDSIIKKNESPNIHPYSYSLFLKPSEINRLKLEFDENYVDSLTQNFTIDSSLDFRYNLDQKNLYKLFGSNKSLHIDRLYNNVKFNFNKYGIYRFRTAFYPFKGVQLFFKRLRKSYQTYCKRNSLQSEKFIYFAVEEYGPKTLRPHFHLLIFSNSDSLHKYFKSTLVKHTKRKNIYLHECWKLGFVDFQYAHSTRKVSTYIAGYINSFSILPSTHIQSNIFQTKHSHSKSLGFDMHFYAETVSWFKKNVQCFNTERYNYSRLLESDFIDSLSTQEFCGDKSELLTKYPAIVSRLFPKLPFSFLSGTKYNYQLLEEIVTTPDSIYKKGNFIDPILFPHSYTLLNQYLDFMLNNYTNFAEKIFASKSFKLFYTLDSGDASGKPDEILRYPYFKRYCVHHFTNVLRSSAIAIHGSIKNLFPDYTFNNRINQYANLYRFAYEMRDRFLLKKFYPTLNEYMSANHYTFQQVAPLFYPTDYDSNQLTKQISQYLTSLIPEYTKHRLRKEPK